MTTVVFLFLLGVFATLFWIGWADAAVEEKPAAKTGDMPEHTLLWAPETHIPLRIKPGKSQIIHLDQPVADAVVDDMPERITVIPKGNDLILFPHSEGGAHITVRGKKGETLMARYVVVADPVQKYLRIHQTCKNSADKECDVTRTYYCPNLCYQTHLMGVSPDALAAK